MPKMYDPPSGWRYGFPKEYSPLPNETMTDTLLRDGYPSSEITQWMMPDGGVRYTRFWTTD